ncbi:hypothetical protein SEVIR_9G516400v4 [Setaria viridis]
MATDKQRGDDDASRREALLNADVRKEEWQVVAAGSDDDKPLGRMVLEESRLLWEIVAPAIFSRIATFSMNVITQAFAGHLGDLELAAISIANTVIVGFNFGLMVPGHGERAGDAVRAGVRRQEVPHDGGVHAALLDRAPPVRGAPPAHVLLRRGRAPPDGAVAGAVGDDRPGLRVVHPAPLLLRLPLPAAAVPAVPDEELNQRRRIRGRARHPPLRQLALHLQVPVRARRHRAHAQLLVVGHRRHALRLRLLRWVPGDVARLLPRGLHRHVGFPQALLRIGRHAVVRVVRRLRAACAPSRTDNLTLASSLENWYYRILVLLTGNLPDAAIAVDALSICMTINGWEMMIPLAFFAGSGVRVANELGAGNGKGARFATIVSSITSLVIGLFFWVLVMVLHHKFAIIFTSSNVVLAAVDHLSVLLALTILLNSIQPVLSGVAVGSGWQSMVAYVNIGSYYLIGIPMGILLGWLFNLGVLGIWAGMIGGTAVQTLILAIITVRCDWEKEALIASTRMENLSEPEVS